MISLIKLHINKSFMTKINLPDEIKKLHMNKIQYMAIK